MPFIGSSLPRPRAGYPPPRRAAMGGKQIPASTRGLNLHDGIASMKPADALVLDNWFPEATYLRVRGGRTEYATGIGSAVQSIMEWSGPSARSLFAATQSDIYDISSSGAVGAAVVSGLTSGYWTSTMITTAGGAFLVIGNGADAVRNFDGTTWTTPVITNVSSADLNNPCLHKSRLWFVETGSTKAWYLPTSSIAGAASPFQIGERFTDGGHLVAIGAVSRDGGSGSDDYLAFISSHGQVAVFQGDDPASANTWALVGVYNNAPPIGNNCIAGIAGDLAILTESAIVSTRQLMSGGQDTAQRTSVSNRIDQGIIAAFASYGALDGWQVVSYPRYRMAVFNVPTAADTAFQFVVNTQTGAWCTYGFYASPLNATCWGIYHEQPYYGTADGTVYLAETGYSDAGAGITAQVKSSFQPYGKSTGVARLTMIQPLFTAGGQPVPQILMNVDYRSDPPMSTDAFPLTPGGAGSLWDVALWDVGTWGGSDTAYNNWYAATGIGSVASVNMITVTNGYQCILNAWELRYEAGQKVAL
jgi:hypothetical protein